MVERGNTVKVDFIGRLRNGAEFSNSYLVGEPLQFTLGQGVMLAAFEDAICGMSAGDEKHVEIPCAQAYGRYDEAYVERVPVSLIPNAFDLPMGEFIVVETPTESLRARVLKQEGGWVYLDRNHELAGEDLLFDIKLVEIVGEDE